MNVKQAFANSGRVSRTAAILAALFLINTPSPVSADILDTIGVTLLRQTTTNLNGAGIRVAQVEASGNTNSPDFQVNPAAVNQPVSLFTYYSDIGTSSSFPNAIGSESGHANGVAGNFFGIPSGVSTNILAADNYDATYFFSSIIQNLLTPNIPAAIVNQSYIFLVTMTSQQTQIDAEFDNYADRNQKLFISGVGNGGPVNPPATCYNGIGVGAIDGSTSVGPTPDNQRSKPDVVAFGGATSFSTPFVAGCATVLRQAALRGDGGIDTNAASNMRTLKALLLNGAIKPTGWTNGPSTPLDARHGAGLVNLFNSYRQLVGGKHNAIEQTSVSAGSAHPPGGNASNISAWSGWNYDTTLSSTVTQDRVKHYYFNLTNDFPEATFTLTATLVWNRQENQTAINDLDLFLYDCANSNLVAESISGADNVEHLYVRNLPPGRYDLQVLKYGGTLANGRVTSGENYALAWEFFAMPLAVTQSDTNVVLSWPIYPTGFVVESTPNLSPPGWTTIVASPVVINGTNSLTLPASANQQFFRLRRPAF